MAAAEAAFVLDRLEEYCHDTATLAALRAWYEGVPARSAIEQYLPHALVDGASARSVARRRQLQRLARSRQRPDLAETFALERRGDEAHARAVAQAIGTLRALPEPQPLIGDRVEQWLPTRIAAALRAAGIDTLAALTLRVPRRRRWWTAVSGLGATGARQVEAFFATAAGVLEGDNPQLAEKLRRASPHWTRHTHASHALELGAELTTVRDNLRHASISTTSTCLHGDDTQRARERAAAFSTPQS